MGNRPPTGSSAREFIARRFDSVRHSNCGQRAHRLSAATSPPIRRYQAVSGCPTRVASLFEPWGAVSVNGSGDSSAYLCVTGWPSASCRERCQTRSATRHQRLLPPPSPGVDTRETAALCRPVTLVYDHESADLSTAGRGQPVTHPDMPTNHRICHGRPGPAQRVNAVRRNGWSLRGSCTVWPQRLRPGRREDEHDEGSATL